MKKPFCKKSKINPTPISRATSLTGLIDQTFLAYNAGRLREACQIFTQKMAQDNVLVGVIVALFVYQLGRMALRVTVTVVVALILKRLKC